MMQVAIKVDDLYQLMTILLFGREEGEDVNSNVHEKLLGKIHKLTV